MSTIDRNLVTVKNEVDKVWQPRFQSFSVYEVEGMVYPLLENKWKST